MRNEKEIWKPIKGFEGKYEISNTGRVMNLNYLGKGEKIECKTHSNERGYTSVFLGSSKTGRPYLVHRLVARAFIPVPETLKHLDGTRLLFINHKDECPTNNNVANLEWCDCKYNINYGNRNKKCSEAQLNRKDKSRPVSQFTKDGMLVSTYPSIMEAHRQTGVNCAHIQSCAARQRKSAGGYIWEYQLSA